MVRFLIIPSSTGPVHMQDLTLSITLSVDTLASNGARVSTGAILMSIFDMSSSKYLWLSMTSYIFAVYDTSFKIAGEILRTWVFES